VPSINVFNPTAKIFVGSNMSTIYFSLAILIIHRPTGIIKYRRWVVRAIRKVAALVRGPERVERIRRSGTGVTALVYSWCDPCVRNCRNGTLLFLSRWIARLPRCRRREEGKGECAATRQKADDSVRDPLLIMTLSWWLLNREIEFHALYLVCSFARRCVKT